MGLFKNLAQLFSRPAKSGEESLISVQKATTQSQKPESPGISAESKTPDLLSLYIEEAVPIYARNRYRRINPQSSSAGAAILKSAPEDQVIYLLQAMKKLISTNRGFWSGGVTTDVYSRVAVLKRLIVRLLQRNLPFQREQIDELLEAAIQSRGISWELPWDSILSVVDRFAGGGELGADMKQNLTALGKKLSVMGDSNQTKKLMNRIRILIEGAESRQRVELKAVDAWTDAAIKKLHTLPAPTQQRWYELLNLASTAATSKPSKIFLKKLTAKVQAIGSDSFADTMRTILDAVGTRGPKDISNSGNVSNERTRVHDDYSTILRGLIWSCIGRAEDSVIAALGSAAARCYEKVPNIGPRSPMIGNACVYSLSMIDSPLAISQLTRLRTRVKHSSVRNQLDKAVARAAGEAGISTIELEELAVPTFGLTDVGVLEVSLAELKARLTVLDQNSTELIWIRSDGKIQKSVPKTIKDSCPGELKKLRNCAKDIQSMLTAQRNRIERMLLYQPCWTLADWKERYLNHPLLGVLARRLIWQFQQQRSSCLGIWYEGKIVDDIGRTLRDLNEETTVRLWHPIESRPEVVLAWRIWIEEKKIRQPFKQAHREVYYLTPAELQTGTYSNRFAAHVIKQHQFAALCQERGWKYTLQGRWDSYNIPAIVLQEFGLRVEFWVDPIVIDLTTQMGVFFYVATDQVRFYELGEQEPMRLDRVPAIVFSELMRDVDLFVGVCSVGNDPNWRDAGPEGHRAYWNLYSFGDLSETAKTRKELLQRLIPRLKIADRCQIDGNFLVVRGDIRTYKIHLGSGNILMSPNDAYLCIVPGPEGRPTADRLVLPFDGDRTLSVILSKAFLLAEDNKIKDPSIVFQIRNPLNS